MSSATGDGRAVPVGGGDLRALEARLDGAALWGLELDSRFRVLAATFEPRAEAHPRRDVPDRRLQVLFYPVGELKASLRRHDLEGGVHVETFTDEQLVDVVDSFGGVEVPAPFFDQPDPSEQWPPRLSLQGQSIAPDGTAHSLTLTLAGEGGRRFDFHVTFDAVRVMDPEGREIPLADLS